MMLLITLMGCVKTVSRSHVVDISTENKMKNQHYSWYQNTWVYVGSDVQFDYLHFHYKAGFRKKYRVLRDEQLVSDRMPLGSEASMWRRIQFSSSELYHIESSQSDE